MLRGRCKNCGAPITPRYFIVELLTGVIFMTCWLAFGHQSPWLALVYAVFLAGLIVATFIDFEHFIIPDSITLGGAVTGLVFSFFLPQLQSVRTVGQGMVASFIGIAAGAGIVYGILRLGKLLFGRQKMKLPLETKIVFSETALCLPDREIPYEEIFYRKSDAIVLQARMVELVDRGYQNVPVRLSPDSLKIGDETLAPETVLHLEVVCLEITVPREAMGLGDVKFMAAIGAFTGWPGVLFSLLASSVIGSAVGLGLILARKREMSSRMPYGPYLALAAAIWVFAGRKIVAIFWE
jgi:leader peptidase (prepilin peptidase)/N-methyltransferase